VRRTAAGIEGLPKIARSGTIEPDSGGYLPPVRVESFALPKQGVMHSGADSAAQVAKLASELQADQLVTLPLRLPWMKTACGFVHLCYGPLFEIAVALVA